MSMKLVKTSMAILLSVPLSLPGCGKQTEESVDQAASTTSPALIGPCELITEKDAEQLLGEAVKGGERSEEDRVGMKLCLYNPVDADSLRFLQVNLTQPGLAPPGVDSPTQIFHSIREAMSADRIDLDDLGEAAFVATGGLYLLEAGYLVSIGAGNTSRPDVQARLRAAAEVALTRLKALH